MANPIPGREAIDAGNGNAITYFDDGSTQTWRIATGEAVSSTPPDPTMAQAALGQGTAAGPMYYLPEVGPGTTPGQTYVNAGSPVPPAAGPTTAASPAGGRAAAPPAAPAAGPLDYERGRQLWFSPLHNWSAAGWEEAPQHVKDAYARAGTAIWNNAEAGNSFSNAANVAAKYGIDPATGNVLPGGFAATGNSALLGAGGAAGAPGGVAGGKAVEGTTPAMLDALTSHMSSAASGAVAQSTLTGFVMKPEFDPDGNWRFVFATDEQGNRIPTQGSQMQQAQIEQMAATEAYNNAVQTGRVKNPETGAWVDTLALQSFHEQQHQSDIANERAASELRLKQQQALAQASQDPRQFYGAAQLANLMGASRGGVPMRATGVPLAYTAAEGAANELSYGPGGVPGGGPGATLAGGARMRSMVVPPGGTPGGAGDSFQQPQVAFSPELQAAAQGRMLPQFGNPSGGGGAYGTLANYAAQAGGGTGDFTRMTPAAYGNLSATGKAQYGSLAQAATSISPEDLESGIRKQLPTGGNAGAGAAYAF